MAWVVAADVLRVSGLPASGGPVSDADINANIEEAQREVEGIAKTRFLYVEDNGTATSATDSTLVDSGQSWTNDQWNNLFAIYIYEGTGVGQMRTIIDNDATSVTVDADWGTNPSTDSKYRIFQNTRITVSEDGSGYDTFLLDFYPLFNLREVTIKDTSITTTSIHQYKDSGKLILGEDSEVSTWLFTKPQQIDLDYYYGHFENLSIDGDGLPKTVKRLTLVIAAIMTLTSQIGGTYNDITSFQLPELSGSLGEPFTNIRETLKHLTNEAKFLMKHIPRYGVR